MTREGGTVEQLALALGEILQPLQDRLKPQAISGFFDGLGVRLPPGFSSQAPLSTMLSALAAAAGGLSGSLAGLRSALDGGDAASILSAGSNALNAINGVLQAIVQSGNGLTSVALTFPGLSTAQRGKIQALAADFKSQVVLHLIVDWIEARGPALVPALSLSGFIDDVAEPGEIDDPISPPYRRRRVRFDLVSDLLTKPASYLEAAFGLGRADFDGLRLFTRIQAYVEGARMPVTLIKAPGQPNILEAFLFRLAVDPTTSPPAIAFRLRMPSIRDFAKTTPLNSTWSFAVETKGRFQGGLEGRIGTNTAMSLKPPAGTASLDAGVALAADWGEKGLTLLGETGGSRLTMQRFSIRAGVATTWSGTALEGTPAVSIAVEGGKAVIDTSKGDSFLQFLTGRMHAEATFSMAATWTASGGLKFSGSSGLEIAIPTHASVGPATLTTFYLRAGVDGDGSIPVELSGAISATLGPLLVSVDRIGVIVRLSFPKGGGNLGPIDVGFEIKWPNGVGLGIDAGGFKGGGFLYFDPPKGEYAGALELNFLGIVDVKAIGILNTKVPGADFSLLIIISAEFIPIQLGFGFTLVGVGGLLGLNRTVEYEALRAGVHDGSINSILFPQDIIANAPRIINDLKRIFPPLADRFLIGPMAKLGWGTPTLISLEIGIILEIPRPAFAILGVLRVALPGEDVPLLNLQVNFLGIVDFATGQLSFDASLFDSHILTFTLTGDMAVRIYWGENANFLLTVGGFHPAYTPPPMGLGPLERLAIDIFPGLPRVRAEAYFAVTSNTVQFGAKVELYAGADIFNVYGFLALDVLFQFSPFHFIAEFSAMLAVRSGSSTLFSVRVDALLEGPAPFHARGSASFEIGFIITITISVHFDVTFGDNRNSSLPPADVLAEFAAAVAKNGNWRAVVPAGSSTSVTLKELPAATTALVLHPFGSLEITQKVVPLHVPIGRFGTQRPAAGTQFTIAKVVLGANQAATEATREQFAPAQFFEMSDADKLSRRSFERYDAGVRVGGGDRPRATYFSALDVAYEVIYLPEKRKGLLFLLTKLFFDSLVKGSAVAQSALSFERRAPSALGTAKVAVDQEKFAVAATKDLTMHAADLVFETEAEAHAAMQDAVGRSPDLARELQVVPLYQVARS